MDFVYNYVVWRSRVPSIRRKFKQRRVERYGLETFGSSTLSMVISSTENINYPNVHRLWVYNGIYVGDRVCIAVAGFCW